MPSAEDGFRRLTIGDQGLIASLCSVERRARDIQHLDARTEALLRIGALIALDAPPSSYRAEVEAAQRAGARMDDLFAVLVAVAGTSARRGSSRLRRGSRSQPATMSRPTWSSPRSPGPGGGPLDRLL